MSVLTSDNRSNAWLSVVAHRWVGHVRTQENHLCQHNSEIVEHLGIFLYVFARKLFATHGLVENFWSDGRNQN